MAPERLIDVAGIIRVDDVGWAACRLLRTHLREVIRYPAKHEIPELAPHPQVLATPPQVLGEWYAHRLLCGIIE